MKSRCPLRLSFRKSRFAVVAVLSIVALGCGGDEERNRSRSESGDENRALLEALPRNLVAQDDLRAVPGDSPQRALLEWFQAVQFRDTGGVELFTSRPVYLQTGPARVEDAVRVVGSALGEPFIVSVRRARQRVILHTLIRAYSPDGGAPVSSDPEDFEIIREAGTWRLANLDYLVESARAMRRSGS